MKKNKHGLSFEVGDIVALDTRLIVPIYNEKGTLSHWTTPSAPYGGFMVLNEHMFVTQFDNVIAVLEPKAFAILEDEKIVQGRFYEKKKPNS